MEKLKYLYQALMQKHFDQKMQYLSFFCNLLGHLVHKNTQIKSYNYNLVGCLKILAVVEKWAMIFRFH